MNRMADRFAVLLLGTALILFSCSQPGEVAFDRVELESDENLSESLANDLLALSVALRNKNIYEIRRYFENEVHATPIPTHPLPDEPIARWVFRHGWEENGAPSRSRTRTEFLAEIESLLAHFSVLEDARIKVKNANFSGPGTAQATVTLFFIGRDPAGRREWLRGKGRIETTRQEQGPWRIGSLILEDSDSQVTAVDLFSEVTLPAGVAALFPPFGVAPNLGFASHGAAVADVNNDGLVDIAATGVESNFLYLNTGEGNFQDVSKESLVGYAPPGTGALFLDFDNDGDQDLFLAAVGEQILLENRWIPQREILFRDVSDLANIDVPTVGFSAVAADVNRDGFPDIYVASYNLYGEVMPNAWHQATNGTRNLLFLNQADGTFREVGEAWGVDDGRWSYAAGFADMDGDFDQDLYVANDFGENALFRNEGNRFIDAASDFGLTDPGFGMGVSFGDFDNDGDLDLHVTNMSSTAGARIIGRLSPDADVDRVLLNKLSAGNSLYENLGEGRYREIGASTGRFSAGWAFGGGFVDFDNDGWVDLYTPNGFISGKSMKDT